MFPVRIDNNYNIFPHILAIFPSLFQQQNNRESFINIFFIIYP